MDEFLEGLENGDYSLNWDLLIGQSTPKLLGALAEFGAGRHHAHAERFWDWIVGPGNEAERRKELRSYCRGDVGDAAYAGAEPERLYRNVRLAVATAMTAGRLQDVSSEEDLRELLAWIGRASGLPDGRELVPVGDLNAVVCAAEPLPRLEQLLSRLPSSLAGPAPGYSRARLRLWMRYWLLGAPTADAGEGRSWTVRFATVMADDRRAGHLHELSFLPLDGMASEVFDHPRSAFIPLAANFLGAIEDQYGAAEVGRPVAWSICNLDIDAPGHPHWESDTTYNGCSHSLAARVGLIAMRDGRDIDPACLMAAELDQETLRDVDLEAKCVAASRYAPRGASRISRVVIATESGYQEHSRRYEQLEIVRRQFVADAVEEATGLAVGLRAYLKWAKGLIDWDRAPYLRGRRLSELYIEPEVLSNEVRPEKEGIGGEDGPAEWVEIEAETTEQEYLQHWREQTRTNRKRLRWQDELKTLPRRRAVLVGYPGEGKTVLALMTAHRLATRGLEELTGQNGAVSGPGAGRVTLPVFLRLQALAEQGDLKAAVRAALDAHRLPDGGPLPERLVDHVLDSLGEEHCWLILDGLDEVGDRWQTVRRVLEPLAASRCRIIVTSRPYGYTRDRLPFPAVTEYRLAPLDVKQRRRFLDAWFKRARDPGWRGRVEGMFRGHSSMGEVARNALLLTLACAESELRDLPPTTRRAQLYEWIVRDLIRGAWRSDPPPLDKHDPAVQKEYRRLRRLAWRLFRSEPAGFGFPTDEWFDGLNAQGCDEEAATTQLNTWRQRGVLVSMMVGQGAARQPGYALLHRTFLEFLAARHVATLNDPLAEIPPFLWQPDGLGDYRWKPAAAEFVALLAGCLEDATQGEKKQGEKLIRLIVRDHDERPDAFVTMLRLAGQCLGEVSPGVVGGELVGRVVAGIGELWRFLLGSVEVASALRHVEGRTYLADALLNNGEEKPVRMRAAEALGALGNAAAAPALAHALRHDRFEAVRRAAAAALGALGGAPADVVKGLAHALREDQAKSVRQAAAEALGALGDAPADVVKDLSHALRNESSEFCRLKAAEALGALGDASEDVVDALAHALRKDTSGPVRRAAAEALGALGDASEDVVKDLSHALRRDEGRDVSRAAAEALGALGGAAAAAALAYALRDDQNEAVRRAAAAALGRLGDAPVAVVVGLAHTLRDNTSGSVRRAAAAALGALGDASEDVVDALAHTLREDGDEAVRRAAAAALGALGGAPADVVKGLAHALREDQAKSVRRAAAEALGALGDAPADVVKDLSHALGVDGDEAVRRGVAAALGRLGGASAASALARTLRHDKDGTVQESAAEALGMLLILDEWIRPFEPD